MLNPKKYLSKTCEDFLNTEILSFVFQVKEQGFLIQTIASNAVVFPFTHIKWNPRDKAAEEITESLPMKGIQGYTVSS